MLNFLKKKKSTQDDKNTSENQSLFFDKLKNSLTKTKTHFFEGLANLTLGKKTLDKNVLEKLETILLTADVGPKASASIIDHLTSQLTRKELNNNKSALHLLQIQMKNLLKPCEVPNVFLTHKKKPMIILMVGMNGAGKTTSIGKLAFFLKKHHKKIMLAAGDTFRAAAILQLKVWGEKNHIPVIAQDHGADSAAVIYDAAMAARARNIDVLIADTAGRLHTQTHLMDELKKIKRVLKKFDANAPDEILLVLDASIGQNGLHQAVAFHEAIGITGLIITKLDGTAKGGIIFAIANQLALPVYFLGLGENIEDFKPFYADEFVDALFL